MSSRNFYEILNVQPNASVDELKCNYKQLILQCHPDKLQQDKQHIDAITKTTTTEAAREASKTAAETATVGAADPKAQCKRIFVAINEAWNTLRDPARRKLYDTELLLTKFQTHSNVFARLTLADMKRTTGSRNDIGNVDLDVTGAAEEGDDSTTLYTYDCRCGGQYVVDESADNEIFNRYGGADGVAVAGDDDYDDNEVLVECSECSLVIILCSS